MKLSAERVNRAVEHTRELLAHIDAQAAEIESPRKVLEAAEFLLGELQNLDSHQVHIDYEDLAKAIQAHKEKYPGIEK